MKILGHSQNYHFDWNHFNKTMIEAGDVEDIEIDCSRIDNVQEDVDKIKELQSLNMKGDLIIKSSDGKVLDYLALALKDIPLPNKMKKIIYEGKMEESLEKHLWNCKDLNYQIGVSPETAMWLSKDTLEAIDGIFIGYNTGDLTGLDRFYEDVKNEEIREKLETIIANLIDRANKKSVQLTTLDKIVYVSNHIQANYQFCQGILSDVKGIKYETPQKVIEEMGLKPRDSKR